MGTTDTPGGTRPPHAVALIKQVPLGDHPGTLDGDGRLLRDGFAVELNPWCRRAVTRAVELGQGCGGRTTVVTMGPPGAADVLKEALACGADEGLHVCDPVLAGADCLVTAKALAAAVRTLGPVDVVLVGRGTVDGGTGAVGPMVAALLGLPFAGPVLSVEPVPSAEPVPSVEPAGGRRLRAVLQLDAVTETVELALPAVLSVAERSCRPAKAPRAAWPDPAPIRVLTADRLAGVQPGATSPTRVERVLPAAPARRPVLLSGTLAERAARAVELITAGSVASREAVTTVTTVAPARVPRPAVGIPAAPIPNPQPRPAGPALPPAADGPALLPAPSAAGPASPPATADPALHGPAVPPRPAGPALHGPAVLAVTGSPEGGGRALLGEAAALAARIGGYVVAVTPPAEPSLLASWGADGVLRLAGTEPRPAAAALARWIRRRDAPWAVLGGVTPWDREVLARLAVHLDAGLLSDVTATSVRDDRLGLPRLVGRKPSAGGTLAEIGSDGVPQIATLRTGSLAVRTARAPYAAIPVETLHVPADPLLRRLERRAEDDFDALERAQAVIGLGAGVDPDHYAEVEPLRAVLGAELAATRKVTDPGSLPHCRQVGVTGRDIAPRLYVALGVSGSPHHMAGVQRAHIVLAVNNDPDAEVFAHCDIGIVADWRTAVPALAEAFRRAAAATPQSQAAVPEAAVL